jgi:hypothetical protein
MNDATKIRVIQKLGQIRRLSEEIDALNPPYVVMLNNEDIRVSVQRVFEVLR